MARRIAGAISQIEYTRISQRRHGMYAFSGQFVVSGIAKRNRLTRVVLALVVVDAALVHTYLPLFMPPNAVRGGPTGLISLSSLTVQNPSVSHAPPSSFFKPCLLLTHNKHQPESQIFTPRTRNHQLCIAPTIERSHSEYTIPSIIAQYGYMSIENLKTFDPFAEADEDTGETKQSQNYIHIRIQQRNGRKTLTTVQGLPKKFDQKKILKVIKKKFACNGTIVNDTEMGEVIQLQGDQRKDVQEFLVDKKEGLALDAKTIKVHGF
ncbi:MAG: hypothetical protein LQ343_004476 [Gyalolechia ehrenbergii]|nr:MAG: hypothetical protein LQ343_004476 [Gyalolechia ehrenbergii]